MLFRSISALHPYLPIKAVYIQFYFIQALIIFVAALIHMGLEQAGRKGDKYFVRFYMASSAVKLFAYMFVMVVFAIFNHEQAFGFILHFLMLYLLYTALEVGVYYKRFGRKVLN